MANVTTMTSSFKSELPRKIHDFTNSTGNTYSMALIKSGATNFFDGTQTSVGTVFTSGTPSTSILGTDDLVNAATHTGYTGGGINMTNITPANNAAASSTKSYWQFSNTIQWTSASFTTQCAVLYWGPPGSNGNTVAVFDLGGNQTVTSGTFTIVQPTNGAATSLLQIN